MPGGPVRLEKAKKVVQEEDEEFNPEITKSKKVKAARMKRPAKRAKEPKKKKSKRSEYNLVDETDELPTEHASPRPDTTEQPTAATPTPNIFSQDASGLEGIDINIEELLVTPPSQKQNSTPQETPSQQTS